MQFLKAQISLHIQGRVVQNLTKLLRNLTLKFLSWNSANMLIFFAEKIGVAFALHCKSYSNFCSKNINVFENTLATTVNKFVINKLVKLTMLWTNGPCLIKSFRQYIVQMILQWRPLDPWLSRACSEEWLDCMDAQANLTEPLLGTSHKVNFLRGCLHLNCFIKVKEQILSCLCQVFKYLTFCQERCFDVLLALKHSSEKGSPL